MLLKGPVVSARRAQSIAAATLLLSQRLPKDGVDHSRGARLQGRCNSTPTPLVRCRRPPSCPLETTVVFERYSP